MFLAFIALSATFKSSDAHLCPIAQTDQNSEFYFYALSLFAGSGSTTLLKGIVSQDFEWLQMGLINRLCVPDVLLEVYSFLNFCFHIVIKFLSL